MMLLPAVAIFPELRSEDIHVYTPQIGQQLHDCKHSHIYMYELIRTKFTRNIIFLVNLLVSELLPSSKCLSLDYLLPFLADLNYVYFQGHINQFVVFAILCVHVYVWKK
jgi:hypothetical protein